MNRRGLLQKLAALFGVAAVPIPVEARGAFLRDPKAMALACRLDEGLSLTPKPLAITLALDTTAFNAGIEKLTAYLETASPSERLAVESRVMAAVQRNSLVRTAYGSSSVNGVPCVRLEPGGLFAKLLASIGG